MSEGEHESLINRLKEFMKTDGGTFAKDRGDGSVYRRDLKLQVSMFSSRVSCRVRDTK